MNPWRRIEDEAPPIDGTEILGYGQVSWSGHDHSGPKHQAVVRAEDDWSWEAEEYAKRWAVVTHVPETAIMLLTHWKHLDPNPE